MSESQNATLESSPEREYQYGFVTDTSNPNRCRRGSTRTSFG
jgi:hypothetical protein